METIGAREIDATVAAHGGDGDGGRGWGIKC